MSQLGFERATAAAKTHDIDALRELVDANPALVSELDDEEHTLLDQAMWHVLVQDYSRAPTIADDPDGRGTACVRYLLDAGTDVNGRNADGWTPLHTALYCNHVELTRELLARGADVTAEAYAAGGTPLVQALFWGHAEAADELVSREPSAVLPRNLRVAAGLGRTDLFPEMFDADGALTETAFAGRAYYRPHPGFYEWTPSDEPAEVLDEALCYAVRNGRLAVLGALVSQGACVDAAPYAGSALHWAAWMGRVDACEWLLDQGANPNVRSTFGSQLGVTPLHACAPMNRAAAARVLLARGADLTAHDDSNDSTPLGWAEFFESEALAEVLRAAS